MAGLYAENTSVTVEKSKAEMEKILQRYGADEFVYGTKRTGDAMVGFCLKGRTIRFQLKLPCEDDDEFRKTPGGRRERSDTQRYSAWEQACRQKWRALCLVIKAKLEAATSGISTIEEEFLSWTVLPNNQTVGDLLAPQIDKALAGHSMPVLPALTFDGKRGS